MHDASLRSPQTAVLAPLASLRPLASSRPGGLCWPRAPLVSCTRTCIGICPRVLLCAAPLSWHGCGGRKLSWSTMAARRFHGKQPSARQRQVCVQVTKRKCEQAGRARRHKPQESSSQQAQARTLTTYKYIALTGYIRDNGSLAPFQGLKQNS